MKHIDRQILNIALPSIVSNITVPLLGLVDVAIVGHMGDAVYIGAIAVGSMIFNVIYWIFGFLRMGTSGMTSQSFGRRDLPEVVRLLLRSLAVGLAVAVMIILFRRPILSLALAVVSPSPDIAAYVRIYFGICVWGAPAMLCLYGMTGWFIGMQDSRTPMFMSIGVNIANVATSLAAVYLLDMGFAGIPVGTVVAEYAGMAYGLTVIYRRHRSHLLATNLRKSLAFNGMKHFFGINADIFLRSACLMGVNLFFVSVGARSGDITLAVNALIMQLFTLFSYFMDGFAFSGEALAGRYAGAHDKPMLFKCIRHIFWWGAGVATVFTIAYSVGAEQIFGFITDDTAVINEALGYHWWCVAIPAAGMAGFVWDGVYIGLTATREMLYTIAVSCLTYFTLYYSMPAALGNDRLWLAFVAYLAMRGISQTLVYIYHLRPRIDKWE